jgi:hypothetical protein
MEQPIDPTDLGRKVILWTTIWLAIQTVWGLYSAWAALALLALPSGSPLTGSEGMTGHEPIDMAIGVLGIAMIGAFIVSGFLILRWIYVTNRNAHCFAEGLAVSPGWNVGFFFVPIANLWKPFEGVRETWQASFDVANWSSVEVPTFMRWWWGCWLAVNILGNISFRLSMDAETTGPLLASNALDVLAAIISIPLALLLISLVRQLSEAQARMVHGQVFA